MRKLVHLSDLHFGRVDPAVLAPLAAAVRAIGPDLVVVSGDLTQRARRRQFRQARAFLDKLPAPQVIVPGNHDVPLYDLLRRFAQPLARFRRYVTDDLEPFHRDPEIAVLGLNTARSLTTRHGRISRRQVAGIAARFGPLGDEVVKVVVTHHPFDLPEPYGARDLVGRSRMAMETLARCGVDLLLAGHLHASHAGLTADRFRIGDHSALFVQAGTATSTRGRGEPNAFNLLRIDLPAIAVARYEWRAAEGAFVAVDTERFRRDAGLWTRAPDPAPPGRVRAG